MSAAQRAGDFRTDLSATRLTEWVVGVVDGHVGRLAAAPEFDAELERATLVDVIDRLTRPLPH